MASSIPLALNENNDENVKVVATTNVPTLGTTLDITGFTIEAFLKLTAATADADASTWKGSTATSEVTITDAPNGKFTVAIPAASLTTDKKWWRADAVSGGKRKTIAYGVVTVTDL